jgi:putative thioredoxin
VSPSSATWVVEVGDADFEREVLERSRQVPVVVDFWAPWCGPCRALGPLLERLVGQRGGEVVLAKVNTDEAPNLANLYRVESIPLVIAFRDGQPVDAFVGVRSEPEVVQFLDRLRPSAAEKLLSEAAALENARPEEAERLYRQALDQDRNQDAARLGLARLLMARGQDDEAAELLAEAGTVGETGAEAERLNGILTLKRLARPFGDEAAARQRVAREPKNATALYELGCVLAAAGRYEEALQTLLSAAERDPKLASAKVCEAMVQIFNVIGQRSALADDYRSRLATLLY